MFTPVNQCPIIPIPLQSIPRTLLMDLLFARIAKETADPEEKKQVLLHEQLFYEEYIHDPKLIVRLYREMQEFMKTKGDETPVTAFALAFQISAWLFRQNPRVSQKQRIWYLPDLAPNVQKLWQQFSCDYGNSLPVALRDLVHDLASEPCTQRRFYRKTLDSIVRFLDHCCGPDAPRVQIQKDTIRFDFSNAGKRVCCEAPLDSAEWSGSRLEAYEWNIKGAMMDLSSQNPHVKRRGYITVSFFLEAYEEKPSAETLQSLLDAFPDALLSARSREARVAMIRQLVQLLRSGCHAFHLKEAENLESLLLKNLDSLTVRDGNRILLMVAQSLFRISSDAAQQLAQKLWDKGVEEANETEKEGWKEALGHVIGDLAAPQAVLFLQDACEKGLLDYPTLGNALVQIKKSKTISTNHLEQVSEIARKAVRIALEANQPFQPSRTLLMLIWLMQRVTLKNDALNAWLDLFYSISEKHSDRELVGQWGVQLLEQALVRAHNARHSAAVTHCCRLGMHLVGNKENVQPLPKIARLLANLPEAERTKALYEQFQAFTGAVCRAGYSAEVYCHILQPIQDIKAPELLESKGELGLKVAEKTARIPQNIQALVGELTHGPAPCVIQAHILLDQLQKRKMLKPAEYQEMLNRICAALWRAIDEKDGKSEDILKAFNLLKECFRHMPRDERRQLFEKALKSFFVLADRNGNQALFDKEFPAFMDLLDTELLDYTLSREAKKDLPPFLDFQFAKILLDKITERRDLAPRFCDAVMKRLEKVLSNSGRFDPFKHLQDLDVAKEQVCNLVQRLAFEATPAVWITDQASKEFQERVQLHEIRLARIHQQVVERDFYLNPLNDFIFYLMLPKLQEEDEEEILKVGERPLKALLEMMQGNAHPHALRKLFEILRHNKTEINKSPQILRAIKDLMDSAKCQKVQGNDSDWDSTLKDIAYLPKDMNNDAASRLLRLKLYQAFNKFLIANAAPQASQRDESGEVRWFKQALVCYLKATALQIVTCHTPECRQTVLEILQEMEDCMRSSSAIQQDRACCSMLRSLTNGIQKN